DQALVTASGGTGYLLVTDTGIAGSLRASVTVHVPGVTATGGFAIELNTDSANGVNETFVVGTEEISLVLPVGDFLRVRGDGARLDVAGQSVTGSFTFTREGSGAGATVDVTLADGSFAIGSGTTDFLSATGVAGAARILA